jgi:hypothetical protein
MRKKDEDMCLMELWRSEIVIWMGVVRVVGRGWEKKRRGDGLMRLWGYYIGLRKDGLMGMCGVKVLRCG